MRLVSLLASATEMLAGLGALEQLVGRSHECDYPPEVNTLPVVSKVAIDATASSAEIDAQIKHLASSHTVLENAALRALSIYSIDIPLLQQLRPDVIFTQTQCEVCAVSERDVTHAIAQLTGLQPRVVALAPHRLADIWEDVLRVGEAIGRRAQAEQLVQGYQQRLVHLRTRCNALAGQHKPRVAILEWLDPLMGAGNWTPELITCAGGEPLFGEIGKHTPWLDWQTLQNADPEVIILAPCGFDLARTLQELPALQQHPLWTTLGAVQTGRVYALDGNAYLNRSGPRLVESAELLAYALWGNAAGNNIDRQGLARC
ncbi:MAG TPA: cobalamin-binding protein [Ktedonobacteraceae bacterium]